MERTPLGRTGLVVARLGYGCNRLADVATRADRREVEATLAEAIDRGVDLFDVANANAAGEAEVVLGRAIRARREDLVVCSKVGVKHWASVLVERWADPLRFALRGALAGGGGGRRIAARRASASAGAGASRPAAVAPADRAAPRASGRARAERSFAPRFLERAVAGSLRRLATDRLDVLYLHGPPPAVLANDAVFAKLDDLRRRGWIRCYGVSFTTATTTDEILAAVASRPGIAVVQTLVHPLATIDLARAAAATRARGVALIARQPLDKGALLARDDLAASDAGAARTRAQTLLRFALQAPGVDAVLVGMRSRAHLRENLAALDAPHLSAAEIAHLGAAAIVR